MTIHRRIDLTAGTGVGTASINAGGTYAPDGAGLPAGQASTSGSGTGASFTVTISGGAVVSVDSIVTRGTGYAPADTITLAVAGEVVAAVIDVDTIGGFVDDSDWAQQHTLPTFTPDAELSAGGIAEMVPAQGVISIALELRDGMNDDATPVATPTGATVRAKTVTYTGRDGGVYRQTPEQVAQMQMTYIDDELARNLPSWIRLHSAQLLPATGALWVDVNTEVGT